jgi:hypothetical protein
VSAVTPFPSTPNGHVVTFKMADISFPSPPSTIVMSLVPPFRQSRQRDSDGQSDESQHGNNAVFHFNLLVYFPVKQRIANTLTVSNNVFHPFLVGTTKIFSRNIMNVRVNSLILRPAASRHSSKGYSARIEQLSEMTNLRKVGLWPGTPEKNCAAQILY